MMSANYTVRNIDGMVGSPMLSRLDAQAIQVQSSSGCSSLLISEVTS
jgi:hypothetical protein